MLLAIQLKAITAFHLRLGIYPATGFVLAVKSLLNMVAINIKLGNSNLAGVFYRSMILSHTLDWAVHQKEYPTHCFQDSATDYLVTQQISSNLQNQNTARPEAYLSLLPLYIFSEKPSLNSRTRQHTFVFLSEPFVSVFRYD